MNEREAFWNLVVRGKYEGEQRGWCTRAVKNGYGVGMWKTIRREWHVIGGKLSYVVIRGGCSFGTPFETLQ